MLEQMKRLWLTSCALALTRYVYPFFLKKNAKSIRFRYNWSSRQNNFSNFLCHIKLPLTQGTLQEVTSLWWKNTKETGNHFLSSAHVKESNMRVWLSCVWAYEMCLRIYHISEWYCTKLPIASMIRGGEANWNNLG